jgi:hypothetical protein
MGSDSWRLLSVRDQNQGVRAVNDDARERAVKRLPFSSIRTVTVGFGIAPNLLTPLRAKRALAG